MLNHHHHRHPPPPPLPHHYHHHHHFLGVYIVDGFIGLDSSALENN